MTVDDLFTLLDSYGVDATGVVFNDVGVPTQMHLDHPDMTDDQADYEVTFTNLTNDDAATEGNPRSASNIQLGTGAYGYVRSILPRAALFRISTKF